MKKYISILLMLSLVLGMLLACGTDGTESSGDVSNGVSADVSMNESNDNSSDESEDVSNDLFYDESISVTEVTDEKVLAEIEALLKRYNEYVLIVNMCEGSLEHEDEIVDYTAFAEQWFNTDITKEDLDPLPDPPTFNYSGQKITDERFREMDSFKNLLDSIYISELSEMYFKTEFVFCWEYPDFLGCKYDSFSRYPHFAFVDGYNYSTLPFTGNAALRKRYVDIESVTVTQGTKGYVVNARGSSLFIQGEVTEPDSDVKFLITEENGDLRIAYSDGNIDAGYSNLTVRESLLKFFERYDSIQSLFRFEYTDRDIVRLEPNSDPNYSYEFQRGIGIYCYSAVEDAIFKNIADVYDWTTDIYNTYDAELLYNTTVFGEFDGAGCCLPMIYYSNNLPNKLFIGQSVNYDHSMVGYGRIVYYAINEQFFDEFKYLETDSGYLVYCLQDYVQDQQIYHFYYLDKIDPFGDGKYELRINKIDRDFDLDDIFGITE